MAARHFALLSKRAGASRSGGLAPPCLAPHGTAIAARGPGGRPPGVAVGMGDAAALRHLRDTLQAGAVAMRSDPPRVRAGLGRVTGCCARMRRRGPARACKPGGCVHQSPPPSPCRRIPGRLRAPQAPVRVLTVGKVRVLPPGRSAGSRCRDEAGSLLQRRRAAPTPVYRRREARNPLLTTISLPWTRLRRLAAKGRFCPRRCRCTTSGPWRGRAATTMRRPRRASRCP